MTNTALEAELQAVAREYEHIADSLDREASGRKSLIKQPYRNLDWIGAPEIDNPAHLDTRIHRTFNGANQDCYRHPAPRQKTT